MHSFDNSSQGIRFNQSFTQQFLLKEVRFEMLAILVFSERDSDVISQNGHSETLSAECTGGSPCTGECHECMDCPDPSDPD